MNLAAQTELRPEDHIIGTIVVSAVHNLTSQKCKAGTASAVLEDDLHPLIFV
jgi:hypothetical protein